MPSALRTPLKGSVVGRRKSQVMSRLALQPPSTLPSDRWQASPAGQLVPPSALLLPPRDRRLWDRRQRQPDRRSRHQVQSQGRPYFQGSFANSLAIAGRSGPESPDEDAAPRGILN